MKIGQYLAKICSRVQCAVFLAHPAEQVQCLIDELPSELTSEQQYEALEFIRCNVNAFSGSEFDLGRTHLVDHSIETSGDRSVRQAVRRHPVACFPQIDDDVQQLQDHGQRPLQGAAGAKTRNSQASSLRKRESSSPGIVGLLQDQQPIASLATGYVNRKLTNVVLFTRLKAAYL